MLLASREPGAALDFLEMPVDINQPVLAINTDEPARGATFIRS